MKLIKLKNTFKTRVQCREEEIIEELGLLCPKTLTALLHSHNYLKTNL